MADEVIIEGSQATPTDRLGRGVRAKVQLTPEIRKLIKIGAVILVDQPYPVPDLPSDDAMSAAARHLAGPNPVDGYITAGGTTGLLPEVPASAYGPDSTPLDPIDTSKPADADSAPLIAKAPPRNGSTSDWQAWVRQEVPSADIDGLSRDELIAVWEKDNAG